MACADRLRASHSRRAVPVTALPRPGSNCRARARRATGRVRSEAKRGWRARAVPRCCPEPPRGSFAPLLPASGELAAGGCHPSPPSLGVARACPGSPGCGASSVGEDRPVAAGRRDRGGGERPRVSPPGAGAGER